MENKGLTGLQKLISALSVRGAKAKVGRETGLTQRTLILIQQGVSVPNPSTRRLIARSLGHSDNYFLDDQPESDALREAADSALIGSAFETAILRILGK